MPNLPLAIWIVVVMQCLVHCHGYSASEDARLIAEYMRELKIHNQPKNHALVARRLVHQASWSAVGSLSTDPKVLGYPMVNVISIADGIASNGNSTGVIYFLLTNLDFTGNDWRQSNKVTFFFSDDQSLNCTKNSVDPMEPTCSRAMISGQVQQLDKHDPEHDKAASAYISRHPRATTWMKSHAFYFCKLNIQNIYVLDWYGGAHDVPVELYYQTNP